MFTRYPQGCTRWMRRHCDRGGAVLASRIGQPRMPIIGPFKSRIATTTQTIITRSFQHDGAASWRYYVQLIRKRPLEYATIPCVAAFVGIMTNWMGVKMLFYPIEYIGYNFIPRDPLSPYGWFGWQGVVPTKTEVMAERLVRIVTEQLLSLHEAFGRLRPEDLSRLLGPAVLESVLEECGPIWHRLLEPILPWLLTYLLRQLQEEINEVLDLRTIVLSAFVRDKVVLVELFQKVGRVELDFLVNSGFGFGFALGLGQMLAWAWKPLSWTLPLAGALVGYVTNWIAIKLLFEPAEPVEIIPHLLELQGLFESRQIEVSDEFGAFMEQRVLNSSAVLHALATNGVSDTSKGALHDFLKRSLPIPIPSHVFEAAIHAIEKVATNPTDYPLVHRYMTEHLDIEHTLSSRLKKLSPARFEDLLHPVFQEDEFTLIVTGGVLGAAAGLAQTQLAWGGPSDAIRQRRSLITILATLSMSAGFFLYQKYEELHDDEDPPVSANSRPALRRTETIVRIKPWEEYDDPGYN